MKSELERYSTKWDNMMLILHAVSISNLPTADELASSKLIMISFIVAVFSLSYFSIVLLLSRAR